jgi:hypothetical protein
MDEVRMTRLLGGIFFALRDTRAVKARLEGDDDVA